MSDRRKITADEYHRVGEMLDQLAHLLLEVGVVELRISKAAAEIYWDTEGGGQVSPDALEAFAHLVEGHFFKRLMKGADDATPTKRRRRA